MTGVLKEKKGMHRDTGGENLIKMEAETWVLCPQAKECQLLATPEAGRERDLEQILLRAWRGTRPADT